MKNNPPAAGQPYITVILPAYNEAGTIAVTIGEIEAYFESRNETCEIIVAADGNDGTRELVRALGTRNQSIRVIGEDTRRGKGRGVREAVALAAGSIVGYADADNKVPIEEYEKVRPWLDQGYPIVIGSRALRESTIERAQPLYRRLGSAGFAVFVHTLVGLHDIVDSQCGFKFFTHAVAQQLFHQQIIDGYMFDVEILALAERAGYDIKQVPIRWRDDHDSRLNLISGNLRNVRDMFRIRYSQMGRSQAEIRGALAD